MAGSVAAVVLAAAIGGDGGDRGVPDETGSVEVVFDPTFSISEISDGHRVVYRLTDAQGSVETDRLTIRPPFESRLETALGAPPGGAVTSVQIGTVDRLALGGVDAPATIARVPGLAPSFLRVGPVLDDALDAGLLERREQRKVLGRRCQVYRSGTTLGAGPLQPITAAEHADSCIDADGLLLEESLFVDSALVFRRTAVDVETGIVSSDADFAVGDPTAPVDQGGGATVLADPTSAPLGRFFILPVDAIPADFAWQARYSVIPPQPDRFADPTRRDSIIAGVADVYADEDGGVFVLYQGGTLGQVDAFAPAAAASTVDGGTIGPAEVVLSAVGSEVRVALSSGRFVHVIGPLEPDVLVGVVRALEEIEGEGLRLLDG